MMSFPSPRMFVFIPINSVIVCIPSPITLGASRRQHPCHFMINQSDTMNIALNKFFHDKFRIDYLNDFNRFFQISLVLDIASNVLTQRAKLRFNHQWES